VSLPEGKTQAVGWFKHTLWLFNIAMEAMAHLWMIFPAINPFMVGIFHGYVSHNQRVSIILVKMAHL